MHCGDGQRSKVTHIFVHHCITGLDWIYLLLQGFLVSLWKSIAAGQPVLLLAAVSTGDEHKERRAQIFCVPAADKALKRERETDPDGDSLIDDSFWILNSAPHSPSTGQSSLRWAQHCGGSPLIHYNYHQCSADSKHLSASTLHFTWWAARLYLEGNLQAQNRKRVLFFQSKSFQSFWWRQMVEGKEGWLKNHFQHIYPLAVEQDTPRGPWSCPLRLICASIPHPHCFSLQFLISTPLSLLLRLLPPLL